LPYANQRQPEDTGVAVYFTKDGEQKCIPCDRWRKVEHNVRAIEKTIGALRGVDRWGAKETVDAAFSGFDALPAPKQEEPWQRVLGLGGRTDITASLVRSVFNVLAKKHHPDKGGDPEEFARYRAAYDRALNDLT
jgi:hypothetical protein